MTKKALLIMLAVFLTVAPLSLTAKESSLKQATLNLSGLT